MAALSHANIIAIFVGLVLFAFAIWPHEPNASVGAQWEAARAPNQLWLAQAIAGMCSLLAVLIGQRWERQLLSRVLLAVAGLALLAALFVFRDFGPRALLTVLVPSLLLFVAAWAMGPMPGPGEDS